MRVLVGCEFSGVVREAFRAKGHDAWSCDLLPAADNSPHHLQVDVFFAARCTDWDLAIFHPPCTDLASSGARWFKDKVQGQADSVEFVEKLWALDIPRIAIENPVGVLSTRSKLGKPTQIIQPWMFGHGETKATCLWLKGLPALIPTDVVSGREARVHRLPPSSDRWKLRSITYVGVAKAMQEQWGHA